MVSDTVALFTMTDDEITEWGHFYMSAEGETERTEVYIVPQTDFRKWLDRVENRKAVEVIRGENQL